MIHIVGGGGKNELLCQMTADATGRRVVVGPYEATALGNALVQAMAAGDVRDLAELRRIVAQSFELTTYEPTGHRRLGSCVRAVSARLVSRFRLLCTSRSYLRTASSHAGPTGTSCCKQ